MRKLMLTLVAAATLIPTLPATAQDRPGNDPARHDRDRDDRGPGRDHPRGPGDDSGPGRDHPRGPGDGRGPAGGPGWRDNNGPDHRGPDGRGPDGRDHADGRGGGNRDWRGFRGYDYNRFEPGQRAYYAERYYRDGSYYQPRRLGRYDRIYRGGNGRYYCRRSDGTTGLIIGGLAGGALGNVLSSGRSSTLATLLGAGGGAVLGRSIDRGQVVCR